MNKKTTFLLMTALIGTTYGRYVPDNAPWEERCHNNIWQTLNMQGGLYPNHPEYDSFLDGLETMGKMLTIKKHPQPSQAIADFIQQVQKIIQDQDSIVQSSWPQCAQAEVAIPAFAHLVRQAIRTYNIVDPSALTPDHHIMFKGLGRYLHFLNDHLQRWSATPR